MKDVTWNPIQRNVFQSYMTHTISYFIYELLIFPSKTVLIS